MSNLSSNVAIFSIPIVAPALLMIAAHYFPWHHTPIGRLKENQARAYGLLGIIIPTAAAVALSDALGVTLSAWTVVVLFMVATLSAGLATAWAYAFDARVRADAKLVAERRMSAIKEDQ